MNAVAEEICQDSFEELRSMAHDHLDKSLEKLRPLFSREDKPDLWEISEAIQEIKQDLSGAIVQEAAHALHQDSAHQEVSSCPNCKKQLKKIRDTSRHIETKNGSSHLTRAYFYCNDCKIGFSPLDDNLDLSQRRKQGDLQQLALKFLAKMPFREAAELFYESTGVKFSDECMHQLFASFAEDITPEEALPSAKEISEEIAKASESEQRRPVLVVAMDGAHMPTRPEGGRNNKRGSGEYKEAKGFRIYLNSKDQIINIASWHQISSKKEITRALQLIAGRIPTDKVRIGLIGDGAPWVWDAMSKAFPTGRQILDYYHVSEYIHSVANAQYAEDKNKALRWVEATMGRLFFRDGARYVIAGLKRMQPNNEDAREQIRKTIQYLEHNKHRINYKGDKTGGYPIGSGGIESANKFICQTRLKRNGAWWLKENSNKMLGLKCALFNGTFERIFDKYAT